MSTTGCLPLQRVEHVAGGGVVAAGGLAAAVRRREPQPVEEHLRKLLGGVDVEGLADLVVDLLLQVAQAPRELLIQPLEVRQVQQHALHLHLRQDGDQRRLDLVHQLGAVHLLHALLQEGQQPQRGLGVGSGVGRRGLDAHLGHADLVLAGADERLDVRHLHAQARLGQVLQPQVARGRVDDELGDHGVEAHWRDFQTMPREHDVVILGVMRHLGDAWTGERTTQRLDDLAHGQVLACQVGQRDVVALAFLHRQRDADDLGLHLVGGGGLGVEGDDLGAVQLADQRRTAYRACRRS